MSGLFIQMHSMHGLVRSRKMELGRDEDTGGQVLYVVKLANELAKLKGVDRVELVTRKIDDPDYPGYSRSIEKMGAKAFIVRVPCGGPKYIKKVNLWPHVDEYVKNNALRLKKLGQMPDIFHANYADAGLVCAKLSQQLDVQMVFTGHSLGKNKMNRMGVTSKNAAHFEKMYHFKNRLFAEQTALNVCAKVVVSSNNEKNVQYKDYKVDAKKFVVIPPGVNIKRYRHYRMKSKDSTEKGVLSRFRLGLSRLPKKPWIFALSRLDARKNLLGLVQAYANDEVLKSKANLIFSPGVLEDLTVEQEKIMDGIRHVIAKKCRERQVLVVGEHLSADEVGALYRLAAKKRGVFVNAAFVEPFGLTTLEAMASGLPVAVTKNGGPCDVISPNQNGMLFDPYRGADIASKIKTVLFEKKVWENLSEAGYVLAREKYSWKAMAQKEFELFRRILLNKV